jgi:hypothetical protein
MDAIAKIAILSIPRGPNIDQRSVLQDSPIVYVTEAVPLSVIPLLDALALIVTVPVFTEIGPE